MNTLGFNLQTLCQLVWFISQAKNLPKSHYLIYGLPDFVQCLGIIEENFHQVAILFNPIGEGPRQMTERPVTFNPFLSPVLIVVQHEEIIQFPETVLDFPAKSIQIDDLLHLKLRVISYQNAHSLRIILSKLIRVM